MSCTVCRLPFVPGPRCATPIPDHLPPGGLMSQGTYNYFAKSTGIGHTVPGCVKNYEYSSNNMFGSIELGLVMTIVWETDKMGPVWMMHPGCTKIFCKVFEREDFDDVNNVIDLCQVKEVLGPNLLGGDDHGKFPGIQYEFAGEKIDLRPYWSRKPHVAFDFEALIADGKQWLFTRPDSFPRFPKVVDQEKRVQYLIRTSESEPEPGSDVLTRHTLDVVQLLVPYLPAQSFLNLTSSCKYLRYHAIMTFQPHVRSLLVDDFPWAFPTALEYESMNKAVLDAVVSNNLDVCPSNADWMLYLTRVHSPKSHSMRARRYIWDVCTEIKRTYLDKLPSSGFVSEVKPDENGGTETTTKARKDLELFIRKMYAIRRMMQLQKSGRGAEIAAVVEETTGKDIPTLMEQIRGLKWTKYTIPNPNN